MFDYWHTGWHMWWMAASWVIGLVMLSVFLWALVHGRAFQPCDPQSDTPESILKRRYARGEIGPEQFERQLTELRR